MLFFALHVLFFALYAIRFSARAFLGNPGISVYKLECSLIQSAPGSCRKTCFDQQHLQIQLACSATWVLVFDQSIMVITVITDDGGFMEIVIWWWFITRDIVTHEFWIKCICRILDSSILLSTSLVAQQSKQLQRIHHHHGVSYLVNLCYLQHARENVSFHHYNVGMRGKFNCPSMCSFLLLMSTSLVYQPLCDCAVVNNGLVKRYPCFFSGVQYKQTRCFECLNGSCAGCVGRCIKFCEIPNIEH